MAQAEPQGMSAPTVGPADIPLVVYLNQRLVLDGLASLRDGFVRSLRVETFSEDGSHTGSEIQGRFGVSSVFALIGVSASGKRAKESDSAQSQSTSAEKTHTIASLFTALRRDLRELGLVHEICSSGDLVDTVPGDFVEAKVSIHKNGFREAIESVLAYWDLTASVQSAGKPDRNRAVGNPGTNGVQSQPAVPLDPKVKRQLTEFLKQLDSPGTDDLVGDVVGCPDLKVVLPAGSQYFVDPSANEFMDADVWVFGKATRVLSAGDGAKISLLRRTGFRALSAQVWETILPSFEPLLKSGAINLPSEIEIAVAAPGIQIVPIAIFV